MVNVRFAADADAAYAAMEKTGETELLDHVDEVVDQLESDPGSALVRRRAFGDGLWGVPIRGRTENWLLIWEQAEQATIVVRYLGIDPF